MEQRNNRNRHLVNPQLDGWSLADPAGQGFCHLRNLGQCRGSRIAGLGLCGGGGSHLFWGSARRGRSHLLWGLDDFLVCVGFVDPQRLFAVLVAGLRFGQCRPELGPQYPWVLQFFDGLFALLQQIPCGGHEFGHGIPGGSFAGRSLCSGFVKRRVGPRAIAFPTQYRLCGFGRPLFVVGRGGLHVL